MAARTKSEAEREQEGKSEIGPEEVTRGYRGSVTDKDE
jgi:hypothetical protein